jgi:putative ABC transport system permease protein
MIRTGDIIGQIGDLLGQIALAIRAAAAVTVLAGIVVLVGAVTASGQARRYDIAILKLLGGSRRQVLIGQAIEYALLSALLIGVALAVGGTGGWYVVTQVLALPWAPDMRIVLATLAAAIAMTLGVGMLGSLPALSSRPATALRES